MKLPTPQSVRVRKEPIFGTGGMSWDGSITEPSYRLISDDIMPSAQLLKTFTTAEAAIQYKASLSSQGEYVVVVQEID